MKQKNVAHKTKGVAPKPCHMRVLIAWSALSEGIPKPEVRSDESAKRRCKKWRSKLNELGKFGNVV